MILLRQEEHPAPPEEVLTQPNKVKVKGRAGTDNRALRPSTVMALIMFLHYLVDLFFRFVYICVASTRPVQGLCPLQPGKFWQNSEGTCKLFTE